MALSTRYEFVLPRGYVDDTGNVHRKGTMRLATARDELEPLRDPTISGPDDPRLTVLVLARVVERLGSLELVTPHEIEGLFAADLAFLQDFYGVINFGSQEEYEELLRSQQDSAPPPTPLAPETRLEPPPTATAAEAGAPGTPLGINDPNGGNRAKRSAIEEIPAGGR